MMTRTTVAHSRSLRSDLAIALDSDVLVGFQRRHLVVWDVGTVEDCQYAAWLGEGDHDSRESLHDRELARDLAAVLRDLLLGPGVTVRWMRGTGEKEDHNYSSYLSSLAPFFSDTYALVRFFVRYQSEPLRLMLTLTVGILNAVLVLNPRVIDFVMADCGSELL